MPWKLLLVEDDRISARYFQRMLADQDFEISVAATCARARELALAGGFSLIVLDHELPDGDGVNLTRWLRCCRQQEGVPIIMCTASDDEETFRSAFEAGVTDFMRKPLRLTELKVRVMNAIRLYEAHLGHLKTMQASAMANVVSVLAHEINNPLAVAIYCGERIREECPEVGKRTELLHKGLERIRSLVADLRVLALTDESAVEWVSLRETLRLASRILCVRNSGPLGVRELDQDEDVRVLAHPGLLAQAVVTLGHQLLDQAERLGGGTLTLGWRNEGELAWVELQINAEQLPGDGANQTPISAQLLLTRSRLSEFGASVLGSESSGRLTIQLTACHPESTSCDRKDNAICPTA